jgi:hypothetical protein
MKLSILRRDPTAALEKARADRAAPESKLADLEGSAELINFCALRIRS